MNPTLLACTVLSLSWPDDITEPPMLEVSLPPPCNSDRDCFPEFSPLCDTNTGQCVECLGPEHCAEGWACDSGDCVDVCRTDAECEGVDGKILCDPEQGICVECVSSDDCPPSQYCGGGQYCRDDHCTPGAEFCFGDTIMLCLEDGGSTMEIQECDDDCDEVDGVAQCVEPSADSGGPGSGGDGSGTTAAATAGDSAGGGTATGGGTAAETSPAGPEIEGEGCTCTAGSRGGAGGGFGLVLLGLMLRRRQRLGVGDGSASR